MLWFKRSLGMRWGRSLNPPCMGVSFHPPPGDFIRTARVFQPGWKRCLLAGPPPPSDALTPPQPPTCQEASKIQRKKQLVAILGQSSGILCLSPFSRLLQMFWQFFVAIPRGSQKKCARLYFWSILSFALFLRIPFLHTKTTAIAVFVSGDF